MGEREEILEEWPYLATLPAELEGFALTVDGRWRNEAVRDIFSYCSGDGRKRVAVVFDKSTKDYMLRRDIGLNSYFDMNYIYPSRDKFESCLVSGLPRLLRLLQNPLAEGKNKLLEKKGIYEWQGYQQFPEQWHGFERFISPDKAFPMPNGAYAILDYSDFSTGSQFLVLYNQLRDSLYAEKRIARTPVATTEFDAVELAALEADLVQGMEKQLILMRKELTSRKR